MIHRSLRSVLFLTLPQGFADCESSSNVGPSWKASGADGFNEDRVVTLGLIGVINSEFRDRLVERIVFPQITGDLCGISRPGVRPRQCLTAQRDVFVQSCLGILSDFNRHLHVAKLPKIIIVPFVVTRPPRKMSLAACKHPLTGNDSFAVVEISALAAYGSEQTAVPP